jgi:hypothetical protein
VNVLETVCLDMPIPVEHVDEVKVGEARGPAVRLTESNSDEEVATVDRSLARSLGQLPLKRRRRR